MTEPELRALVRETIARSTAPGAALDGAAGAQQSAPPGTLRHLSHEQFHLAPVDPEGRCVIEPAVPCNHCGYCRSYGH